MSWEDLNIEGPRVTLRALRDEDVAVIEPWYSEAATAVHGLSNTIIHDKRELLYQTYAAFTQDEGGLLVIMRSGEDVPMGYLDYRLDVPDEGDVSIYEVALASSARRWGLGQEAVRVFEEEAWRRWGVRAFRANVDVGNGLALYFWLRLGYRPLGVGHDVLRMVREARAG